MKKLYVVALVFVFAALLSACQKKEAQAPVTIQKKLTVITTLFPLYDFARAIAGDKADVTLLLPPGIEPHTFEPKPADVMTVNKADIFVFTNIYMEPWAKSFINGLPAANVTIVDTSKGVTLLKAAPEEEGEEGEHGYHHHHHGGMDPHIWMDFANARIMVENILSAMVAKDPANREYYTARAAHYKAELNKLDDEYKSGLSTCGKKVFLHGGHYAFGYLAKRYGLQYQAASAVNADAEPTPSKLAELVKLMRATGLKYVYSEELLSTRSADTIAKETGATVLMLHGAHNISKDDLAKGVTFISLMKKNLENLRTGLECR
ncbi:MAG: zinc ABC transporter substrate-binding protein [Geobacteraceae bacterium]|jgi:zinc transport system substrate-binding protein